MSVDAVVGVNFLQQPLQTNTWQLCFQILHVLLKADPSLEGDVADDADPSVCHQVGQVSILQYLADPGEARGCSINNLVINQLID